MSIFSLPTLFYAATVCLTLPCADQAMAQSAAPWELITAISYEETETETSWKVEKTIPEALRAMAERFEITGFYVPVEAQAYVSQFLLVPDPADCPFCGQNGYGPTLEVQMKRAVPDMAEGSEVTVRGHLQFDESTETYRAVFLTGAVLVD
jgi:hypothetical protein